MEERKQQSCYVLIHSPLVGPLTWEPVAAVLRRRGELALVPDISPALPQDPPYHARIADLVRQSLDFLPANQPLILAGHSGAGPLLPAIRRRLVQPVAGYLFVDAGLPRGDTSFFDRVPPELAGHLQQMAHEPGWLPPWADWFGGESAIHDILPDDTRRREFMNNLSPIPLALLEERIPVFDGWPDAPCGYLQFSEAYEQEAADAKQLGWPLRDIQAGHLHMLVNEEKVAASLLEIASALFFSGFGS